MDKGDKQSTIIWAHMFFNITFGVMNKIVTHPNFNIQKRFGKLANMFNINIVFNNI